jgi:hypothetical protein
MSASFDFEFEENEIPPNFQESLDAAPSAAGEHASPISQIYAAAWSMAHRDHELDKLFNFEFYQQQ